MLRYVRSPSLANLSLVLMLINTHVAYNSDHSGVTREPLASSASPTAVPRPSSQSTSQPTMSATSPPSSPLPKRQKPNPTPIVDPTPSIDSTMASSAPAVTKIDAAPPLLIKKLSDKAKLPTRGSAFAAGYDIYASKDTVVPARGKVLVDTDISMAVPDGTC
jgi:hypothetical protein